MKSPTNICAHLFIPSAFTFSPISSNVPIIIFSSSQVALATTAIGTFLPYPFLSFSVTLSIIDIDKNIAIEAPTEANFSKSSVSGTLVLPSTLVNITVWVTDGKVNSFLIDDAAATKELTPGTTLYSIPYLSNSSICSFIAPYIDGSPVWSLTINLSLLFFITSITSSKVILAELCISTPSLQKSICSFATNEPA